MNSPQETSTVGNSEKITVSQILWSPVPPPIGLKGNYLIFFFLLIKTKFKQILERNYLYILHYIWTRIFFPYNTVVLYCDVHFKNKGLKYVLDFFLIFNLESFSSAAGMLVKEHSGHTWERDFLSSNCQVFLAYYHPEVILQDRPETVLQDRLETILWDRPETVLQDGL